MKLLLNKYTLILFMLIFTLSISACVMNPTEDENLFETLETEEIITLDGEIYPFSVSISTRATHRLANIDGKLIAYLYSDIVDLSQFESHVVELDGYWRNEKMQEIFYVEAIRLQDLEESIVEEDHADPQRFSTKNFTFQYPSEWEYSRSPVGVYHFTDKQDQQRRVFLMFSTEDIQKRDLSQDPNISIAGMKGFRKITADTQTKENQEINLFSNYFDKKYTFVFSGNTEQKKDFLLLINSFVEGEAEVSTVIAEEKRLLAEREASKLKEKQEKIALEELETLLDTDVSAKEADEKDPSDAIADIEQESENGKPIADVTQLAQKDKNKKEEMIEVMPSPEALSVDIPLDESFKNLIDERAFLYTSDYYNLTFKVPFGFWFRNFGPTNGKLFRIGFAPHEINSAQDPTFWLEGISTEKSPQSFTEKLEGENVILEFPRTNTSYFRFSGNLEYRDAMRSILLSIE
jgi:hypothetical protein